LFSWTILMAYSEEELKSSSSKASPCSRSFLIGKLWDKCLPIWSLLTLQYHNFVQYVALWNITVHYAKNRTKGSRFYGAKLDEKLFTNTEFEINGWIMFYLPLYQLQWLFTRDSQKICSPSPPSAGNGMDEILMLAERGISQLFFNIGPTDINAFAPPLHNFKNLCW
jgi:hypothetical protein